MSGSSHRPWVWEVRSATNRVWIAGCLHLGADPDGTAFSAYLPYYERASAVYFEVMPGIWDTPDISALISRRGYAPDRRNLSGRVSDEVVRDVRQALGSDAALLARVESMEPWLACLTITQEGYRRAGLTREAGLEYYIEQRARSDRRPVGALERPQDQIFAMADARIEDQTKNLQNALANFAKPDFGSADIRSAWRSGDEAILRRALGIGDTPPQDEMHYNLLEKRNQQWARRIDEIMASRRPALLVVGVEHLLSGPRSLPELMKAAEYSVQRVGLVPEGRVSGQKRMPASVR